VVKFPPITVFLYSFKKIKLQNIDLKTILKKILLLENFKQILKNKMKIRKKKRTTLSLVYWLKFNYYSAEIRLVENREDQWKVCFSCGDGKLFGMTRQTR